MESIYQILGGGSHLVIEVDSNKAIVDTGAPMSVGRRSPWNFLGTQFEVQPSYLGLTPDGLSDLLGERIDVLLGTDILRQIYFIVDLPNGVIEFAPDCPLFPSTEVPLESVMGVPTTEVVIGSRKASMFVDTGARLSYLRAALLEGLPAAGTQQDFYPGFGHFDTEVREVDIDIAGEKARLSFGVLPPLLEATLLIAGPEGILGTQLYQLFSAHFSLSSGMMRLHRHRVLNALAESS